MKKGRLTSLVLATILPLWRLQRRKLKRPLPGPEALQGEVVALQSNMSLLESRAKDLEQQLADASARTDNAQTSTTSAEVDTEQVPPAPNTSESVSMSESLAAKEAELEEAYKKRTEDVDQRLAAAKTQLQKRLHDDRAKYRAENAKEMETALQSLREEHAQELQKVKDEHAQELENLRSEHKAELDSVRAPTLQENGSSSTVTESEPAAKAEQSAEVSTAPSQPNDTGVNANSTTPALKADFTREDLNTFLKSNKMAYEILSRNIKNHVEKNAEKLKTEHEEAMVKVKQDMDAMWQRKVEEEEQRLEKAKKDAIEDEKQKAEKAKKEAIEMEGKRQVVKFNMIQNRERAASAKISIVETAAKETPQKPVVEVWEVAKAAKPPIIAPVAPQSKATSASTPASAVPPSPGGAQSNATALPSAVPANTTTATSGSSDTSKADESQTPSGPRASQASTQPAAGTGPSGSKSAVSQGSGIPRGGGIPRAVGRGGRPGAPNGPSHDATTGNASQGAGQRGGFNVRGARGGRGGGAGQGTRTSTASNASGSSPKAMNPGAQQFVPGSKRPREDSGGASEVNGKRIRGTGGGSVSGSEA
ncbi:hypothetical protein MRB53_037316 [Persea americana]|nr:hypothetical protein MRB53_037316 [Persea americana]